MKLTSNFVLSFLILIILCTFSRSEARQLITIQLDSLSLVEAEVKLKGILAPESQISLQQILLQVSLIQDMSNDSVFVYDLYIDFDPTRYQNARVGIYPLKFEEQFIFWGKRVANFTKQTSWKSGRFYLHDVSTGKIAWMYTAEARKLYNPPKASPTPFSTSPYTSLNNISQWLQFMRFESRESVMGFLPLPH